MERRAKVFVSCGQANATEEAVAEEVKTRLKQRGFEAYVAREARRLGDLPKAIIDELVASDYLVFIDFRREGLIDLDAATPTFRGYRGSVYSHQELALAHYLGFGDNIVALQHRQILREGFLQHVQVNAQEFDNLAEVPDMVAAQVDAKGWRSDFSRHLVPRMGVRPAASGYGDHTTGDKGVTRFIWGVEIHNCRHDLTALSVTASPRQLASVDGNGERHALDLQDKTWLKWAGYYETYSMVIPPLDFRSFDALSIDMAQPSRVFLNSLFDLRHRQAEIASYERSPIIEKPGLYELTYRIDAIGFPAVEFTVQLNLSAQWDATEATVLQAHGTDEPSAPSVDSEDAQRVRAIPVTGIPGSAVGGAPRETGKPRTIEVRSIPASGTGGAGPEAEHPVRPVPLISGNTPPPESSCGEPE